MWRLLKVGMENEGRSNLPRSNSVTSLSTVHTEEYEDKYRQMSVRHVAGVPVTSFDGVTIASDLDSVHTDAVRQHFKESLRKNKEKMSTSSAESVRQQVQDAKSLRDRYNKLKENDKKRNAAGKDLDVSYSTRPPLSRLKPSYNQNASYDEESDHRRDVSKPSQANDSIRSLDSVLSNDGLPLDRNDAMAPRQSTEQAQQSVDVTSSHRLSSKNSSRKHARSAGPSNRWNRSVDSVDVYAARNRDTSDYVELSKSVPRRSYRGDGVEPDAERHQLTSNALNKLKELDSQIDAIDNKKKASEQELKLMERTIEGHRISLLKLEEKLRENQAKADDARTELMVLEFKKEQCKKELDTTAKELNNAQERINDADDLGMTYDDIVALMQERDELRARVRRGEASKTTIAERQELERALHTAREELFRERKHKREQLEEMDEKLMEVEHNFDSMVDEKKLEIAKLKEIIQNNGSEDKKTQSKAMERADAIEAEKTTLFDKIEGLARQLQDKDREIVSLATESNRSREENQRLNGKVSELESKVAEQISLREKWIAESERNASSLRKEKDLAVASIKGERQSEIEKILQDLDKEKSRAILEAKSAHQEEICRIRSVVENKDTEIEKLRERLHSEEDAKRELSNKLRMESQEQLRDVLQRERSDWEREKEVSEQRQEEMRRAKFEQEKSKLSSEVDEARNKCQMATEQISRLRTEIEELRLENRKQLQEKLDAVSHAREQERKDQAKKYEQLKTELTELNEADMAVQRSKYNKLEEELRNAKQEKHDALLKCKDVSCQAERAERCFLAEIHEECLKIAELIRGIRTPSQSRNRSSAILSRSGSNLSRSNRPANAEGCVSQLRALGDDVRATLRDLTTEVETHRRAAQIAQRERNQVLSSGSNSSSKRLSYQIAELNGHNSQDTQALSKQLVDKDNELRDIQRNMSLWKDTTAQKLAEKFEEELAVQLDRKLTRHRLEHKRQLERMEEEISKLSASTNGHVSMHQDFDASIVAPVSSTPCKAPPQGGAAGEKGTVKLLRHLQGRVKQLRAENDLLRTNGQILDYEGLRKSR